MPFGLCVAMALSVLGGCSSAALPYQPVQLAEGEAAVYLYRPRSVLSPGPVTVVIDQDEVARLARNTHTVVLVGPGEHLVRVQRRSDATKLVRLGPGESLYLEVGAALLGGRVSLSDPGLDVAKSRIVGTHSTTGVLRHRSAERDRPVD